MLDKEQKENIEKTRAELYRFFRSYFPNSDKPEDRAIRYVMSNERGKLSRPLMVIQTARAYGAEIDLLPPATAIEAIHRGSLMLDDLPSMDNSKMRHGGLSCWSHFYNEYKRTYNGECGGEVRAKKDSIALTEMAANLLMLPVPIQLVNSSNANSKQKSTIIEYLANVSKELCQGQSQDLCIGRKKRNRRTVREEIKMFRLKTGSLYATSAAIGGVLGGAPEKDLEHLRIFGNVFGVAYQLVDDFNDRFGDPRELGKPVGQDIANGRPSMAYRMTKKQLKKQVARYRNRALNELGECSADLAELESIVNHVARIDE